MSSQNDEDLHQYLSQQPRRQPKPKRQVSSLTFSYEKWKQQQSKQAVLNSLKNLPPWIWFVGLLGGVFLFSLTQPYQSGPVSDGNLANFPPPHPTHEIISDGQSAVLVTNAAPETMRLTLKGDKDYIFVIEPCRDCGYTDDSQVGQQFCDRAPEQVIHVSPGEYEVFVSFGGRINRFRSEWNLTENWQYGQCIFARQSWQP
jgi:hypothetical protein